MTIADAPHEPNQGTPLTRGLRRVYWLVVGVSALFCVATFAAMETLNHQISRWSHIEEMDALRERLVTNLQEHLGSHHQTGMDTVVGSIDQLADSIARFDAADGDSAITTTAATSLQETRRLFMESHKLHHVVQSQQTRLTNEVNHLQKRSARWSSVLQTETRNAVADATEIEARQFRLNNTQRRLTEALLAAERVQRRLEAVVRLAEKSSNSIAAAATAALDDTDLPTACAPGEVEGPEKLCAPNIARVRTSLGVLRQAEPNQIDQALKQALWALDAYVRTGERRYQELSTELTATINAGRRQRARVTEIHQSEAVLGRINRVFLQVNSLLESLQTANPSLQEAEQTMRVLAWQMRHRTAGFLRQTSAIDDDPAAIERIITAFSENWSTLATALKDLDQASADLDVQMASLAGAISSTTLSVRRSTTLWVTIFASSVLGVALLLAAVVVGSAWLARKRFIAPLMQVTKTIHYLADGRLSQPIALNQRAFGFDRLSEALDKLRRAMIERSELADSNAEQKSIIEQNLRELEQSTQEMQWLAMHDPLTGLGNRRHADQDLTKLTQRGASQEQDFCLIHLDVDRFKDVNDTLGHEAGDFILKSVAEVLPSIAGPEATCYRIGGDEFLIMLKHAPSREAVTEMAENIVREMAHPIVYNGHACRVGASLGIAFGRDAGFDAGASLLNADLALYETKRAGRNGHRFFNASMNEASRQRRDLADLLMAAIEAEEFIPYYQPQFYSDGFQLRGVETLCRWHNADRGWISPGEFLGVAEELKLVGKIDEILFRKAAKDLEEIRRLGLRLPKISFNVTADRLLHANLADELVATLGTEVKIALELLESMSLDSLSPSVQWSIDALKERGINIEIDDFGSCRASVAGLIAVKPDAMKIDRSIIMPLTKSEQHRQLVQAMIEIGRALNIEVVGEGVETDEHIEILSTLGCDVLQGFGLARPMPFEQLVSLLRTPMTAPAPALSAGSRAAG